MTPERLVTLLEILRTYAEIYARSCFLIGLNVQRVYEGPIDPLAKEVILQRLRELAGECKRVNLDMTLSLIEETIPFFEHNDRDIFGLHDAMVHVCEDLRRELALQLFVRIRSEHREHFECPLKGWEGIISRFSNVVRDVEEMNKCFSLCRYTAAMFHAMQVAELGAIELGGIIEVEDPMKGWGPTQKKLQGLIRAGRNQLPVKLAGKWDFLEQMSREIDSMVLSWRHKIDHAANRLAIVPNTDFTPDIAEHIMGAVRVFMLRLQEGIPA